MKSIVPVLAFTLAASCTQAPHHALAADAPIYGWLVGSFLALPPSNLSTQHDFALVDFTHDRKLTHGVVMRKAGGADHCPALLPDRRDVNEASGNTFHLVELDAPADFGIGIVGTMSAEPLLFDQCMTAEGIRFTAMRGSQPVWSGYCYLGYDGEATCRDAADE